MLLGLGKSLPVTVLAGIADPRMGSLLPYLPHKNYPSEVPDRFSGPISATEGKTTLIIIGAQPGDAANYHYMLYVSSGVYGVIQINGRVQPGLLMGSEWLSP